jgi:signal transduction histidine kinase
VEPRISTRSPPGASAWRAGDPDTFRYVVLAHLTRRLLTPSPPAGGGEPGAGLPAGGRPGRSPGLLAGLRDGSEISPITVPPAVAIIRFAVVVMVLVTVPLFTPHFGRSGLGIAIAGALAVSAVAGVTWQFAEGRPRLWLAALVVMGAAGGVLGGLSSLSTAVAISFMVVVTAGARLPTEVSLGIVAETVAAFLIAAIASDAPAEAIVGWSLGLIGLWAFGLTRRAYLFRAVEAEQALEQARRAHAAETQAAALAERARIAREIHDVLAHALAAVSVNLQAAEGLLDAVPDKGPEVAKAMECVERAGALTKEGMAEARRAILALRDEDPAPGDASTAQSGAGQSGAGQSGAGQSGAGQSGAGQSGTGQSGTGQLTARLRALADEHRAAGDAAVEFTVTGTPRPLGADGALTAFRTAQEALTNARKHAPGQPVSLAVSYPADGMTLLVSNPLAAPDDSAPLAHAGAGYGLTGLRERAALAGGTLTSGPSGGRWEVCLRLPARRAPA